MVEHMSAQTIQCQHQQSCNGVQRQRWPYYPHRRTEFQDPRVTNSSSTSCNHRFSLFKWFKRRHSSSSVDNTRRHIFRRAKRRSSTSSTSSSEGTFYSTATVKSFAFHTGARRDLVEHSSLPLKHSSGAVGPFAPGAAKLVEKRRHKDDKPQRINATDTYTLPCAFSQTRDLESRYSLHPVNGLFTSYDSIPIIDRKPRNFAEVRRNADNNGSGVTDSLTSNASSSRTKVHVKGKRRAPDPPAQRSPTLHVTEETSTRSASGRRQKRRPAPKPPGHIKAVSSNHNILSSEATAVMDSFLIAKDCQSISNDTLVLRKGVLLSKRNVHSLKKLESKTSKISASDSEGYSVVNNQSEENNTKLGTIMPRPWYKRNILNEHQNGNSKELSNSTKRSGSDILRGFSSPLPSETKDENIPLTSTSSTPSSSFPFEGSLSKLGFFHRGDRHHSEDKKKENKRKSSCVSILTNISELDREAAAIVQQEQAKNRASMILQAAKLDEDFQRRMGANDAIVQEIVNSSLESSPRRTTRALISKFNAIGNITKVTVNSSFFTKSNNASPKAKNKRYSQECNNAHRDEKLERDLSKYFLPYQSSRKRESVSIFTDAKEPTRPKPSTLNASPLTSAVVSTMTETEKAKTEKNNNMEYVKALTAELDDVATGIAQLRRELEIKPKLINNSNDNQEKIKKQNKEMPININKLNVIKDPELTNFEKEFTKIFDEIDRQFKTRDSRIVASKHKTNSISVEPSIKNQVVNVLDILINGEKDSVTEKNILSLKNEVKLTNTTEHLKKKEAKRKGSTSNPVRISDIDDESTAKLKEMLKEMKHSLPKSTRSKTNIENEKEIKRNYKSSDIISNKQSTNSPITKKLIVLPKSSNKVSSSVQTSGNVRKIINEIAGTTNIQTKENDIIHETILKNKLPKSLYQMMKVDESVETGEEKSKEHQENTYANVIDRYMYSNTQIMPTSVYKITEKKQRDFNSRVKIDLREKDSKVTTLPDSPCLKEKGIQGIEKYKNNEEGKKLEEIKRQYMNTLAVNRLLRKLEAAIASGHHQQAAGLAKELAQLKIHCSVVRQRSYKLKEKINLNMYIEDKQAHQGPIPLQLPVNMTVAQLKAKIHIEFEIPANIQRWIIGKNLADNDELTLDELQAVEGSPVFLYLVAPPDLQDKELIKRDKPKTNDKVAEKENQTDQEVKKKNNEQIDKIKTEIKLDPEPKAESKLEIQEKTVPQPHEEKEEFLTKEEKLQRYEELMSLENCDIISNIEPIECPVCFMIFSPGEGVTLRDCLHTFCRLCVADTVRYCEEAEVKCPYRDEDYTCESTLQEREIKALVAPEVYQQHLAKSIAQAENNAGNNAFHCKTPDCPGWCIYDDNVNNFLCPVCKTNNCLTCQAVHMGKNCRQYQEELKYSEETDHESKRTAAMLEEMVERGEALPCPTCAVVLMKKWGCDWLRCSMCKTEICWVTRGPRWGPGGKGDTSGGCRCGENGVKCHPRCNYCH